LKRDLVNKKYKFAVPTAFSEGKMDVHEMEANSTYDEKTFPAWMLSKQNLPRSMPSKKKTKEAAKKLKRKLLRLKSVAKKNPKPVLPLLRPPPKRVVPTTALPPVTNVTPSETMPPLIFIMTRCLQDKKHLPLWRRCYASIRKFYKTERVIIIDDNSKLADNGRDLLRVDPNLTIEKSQYQGAGELLPYHKFLHMPGVAADVRMVTLHDSMLFRRAFDASELSTPVKFLWHFPGDAYKNPIRSVVLKMLSHHQELQALNEKLDEWTGCFGVASII
jgi:hypothetical protein